MPIIKGEIPNSTSRIDPACWSQAAEWYDENSADFIAGSFSADVSETMQRFLSHLPPSSRILDAGCGSGRDLKSFLALGHTAEGFDASRAMVEASRSLVGSDIPIRQISFKEFDDPPGRWDGIWCLASLLHLPRAELPEAVLCLVRSIARGGALFVSFKDGQGETIDARGRPFTLLGQPELARLLTEGARAADVGLISVEAWAEDAKASGGEVTRWANAILRVG